MQSNRDLATHCGQHLTSLGLTFGAAESCTGGLLLSTLTDVSGSSRYVMGGLVTYSNELKEQLTSVQRETLVQYGAVSEETAREMAVGARQRLGVDVAISITGIAGPRGGTPEKPVGLVYIAYAGPGDVVIVEEHRWDGDRATNKAYSVAAALQLVMRQLAALKPSFNQSSDVDSAE